MRASEAAAEGNEGGDGVLRRSSVDRRRVAADRREGFTSFFFTAGEVMNREENKEEME